MKKSFSDWEYSPDQGKQSSFYAFLIDIIICFGLLVIDWTHLPSGLIFVLIIPIFILLFFLIRYLILRFYYTYVENNK